MTLPIDESTAQGALYGAVKRYSGRVKGLAADLEMPESTLYAKLRGEKGYPLDFRDELDDILGFLRSDGVKDWAKVLQVMCYRHDHLAVPIPRNLKSHSSGALRQVSQMMQEVSDIAQALSDGMDLSGSDGELINSKEMRRIEQACNEAMEKIAETREWYRAQHREAKRQGLVK